MSIEQYEHDPGEEHWGFASWNDFFTRHFKDGERPVASPEDDKVIVSACESTPYGISTDVQRQDQFWIKSQPYSLQDMLADDESVDEFRRWDRLSGLPQCDQLPPLACPGGGDDRAGLRPGRYLLLRGRLRRRGGGRAARLTVLSRPRRDLGDHPHPGRRPCDRSHGVRAGRHVRGLLLHSRHECDARSHVTKGDELGYFQFGGSTHCLVFGPGALADFALPAIPQPRDPKAPLVLVRSKLATAASSARP